MTSIIVITLVITAHIALCIYSAARDYLEDKIFDNLSTNLTRILFLSIIMYGAVYILHSGNYIEKLDRIDLIFLPMLLLLPTIVIVPPMYDQYKDYKEHKDPGILIHNLTWHLSALIIACLIIAVTFIPDWIEILSK